MAIVSSESMIDTERYSFLGKNICVNGIRATGKTEMLKYMYEQIQDSVDEVYLFTCDGHFAKAWNFPISYRPEAFAYVHDQVISNGKSKLFIFDDYVKMYKNCKKFTSLLMNNNCTNSTVFMCTQYPGILSQMQRCNIHVFMTARENAYSAQQKLYHTYLSRYDSIKTMQNALAKLERYEFLVVNMRDYSTPFTLTAKQVDIDNIRIDNVPCIDVSKSNISIVNIQQIKDELTQLQIDFSQRLETIMNKLSQLDAINNN
jgi:hypothetical protein